MCEKRTYRSYKQGATELNKIKHRAKSQCPKRVYYCSACRGFHLTSLTRKRKRLP